MLSVGSSEVRKHLVFLPFHGVEAYDSPVLRAPATCAVCPERGLANGELCVRGSFFQWTRLEGDPHEGARSCDHQEEGLISSVAVLSHVA